MTPDETLQLAHDVLRQAVRSDVRPPSSLDDVHLASEVLRQARVIEDMCKQHASASSVEALAARDTRLADLERRIAALEARLSTLLEVLS